VGKMGCLKCSKFKIQKGNELRNLKGVVYGCEILYYCGFHNLDIINPKNVECNRENPKSAPAEKKKFFLKLVKKNKEDLSLKPFKVVLEATG